LKRIGGIFAIMTAKRIGRVHFSGRSAVS
jgi:hypothetical protein